MGRKKKGKSVKKAQANQVPDIAEAEFKKAPHTFVFARGKTGKNIGELVHDVRRVMEPYTASKLKVRKKNVLKDFVNVAGPLNVTHFLMLSKTDTSVNLRLLRLPRGPTLMFRVHGYSLCRDVVSTLKRYHMEQTQFLHHPLLVMNGFQGDGLHLKLMTTMFQNMFPSLNINKLKLSSVRRCVLINYNQETKMVEFRHYNIRAAPIGLSKGMKKLLKPSVPNMSKYEDISEFLMRDGNLSESEAELDGPHNEVVLPQKIGGKGNMKAHKSAIRLSEIGPRLTMQLIKIEEGICDGTVLYHEYIQKTEEELVLLERLQKEKKQLKEKRRQQQEVNVAKKKQQREANKERSLAGMKRQADAQDSDGDAENSDEDDDEEYFRQEVGVKPDADLLIQKKQEGFKKKRKQSRESSKEETDSPAKRRKLDKEAEKKELQKQYEKKLKKKKKKAEKKKQKSFKRVMFKSKGRGKAMHGRRK